MTVITGDSYNNEFIVIVIINKLWINSNLYVIKYIWISQQ